MEVQTASHRNQGPLHSLWLMCQVFILLPLSSLIVNKQDHLPGFHQVNIDFCDCHTNEIVPHHIQLLRAGWFPSTFIRPQIVFTFHCLDFYHELTLQSKVNAYDFCRSLLRLTDSLELNKTSVRKFLLTWY
jgi:CxC2 like cysteine cluster associated with KDZ transposases